MLPKILLYIEAKYLFRESERTILGRLDIIRKNN